MRGKLIAAHHRGDAGAGKGERGEEVYMSTWLRFFFHFIISVSYYHGSVFKRDRITKYGLAAL